MIATCTGGKREERRWFLAAESESSHATIVAGVAAERSFASGRYIVRRALPEGGQKTVYRRGEERQATGHSALRCDGPGTTTHCASRSNSIW